MQGEQKTKLEKWLTESKGRSISSSDMNKGLVYFFQFLKAHSSQGFVPLELFQKLSLWIENNHKIKEGDLDQKFEELKKQILEKEQKTSQIKKSIEKKLVLYESEAKTLRQKEKEYSVWLEKNKELGHRFEPDSASMERAQKQIAKLLNQARNNLRVFDKDLAEARESFVKKNKI